MIKDVIKFKETAFRDKVRVGSGDPVNLKRLLLDLNVLTMYAPMSETFSGMCIKRKNSSFILINSNHSRGRQHFTIAHEFFHLFIQDNFELHVCNPGVNKEPQEKEADFFASLLLMPEMGILRMLPEAELENKKVSLASVIKLEQYFGVSRTAMLVRLKDIGLITKSQFDALKMIPVLKSALEHGYDLALYKPGNENLVIGDYGMKARQLFEESKISEGHYLELLSKIGIDPTLEE
ncbi:hypothetical protein SDC9_68320 [bioreactor metagenome]|uniref:IrrE N-terminal-like domain-containing protein n=1 Tax=bioreactor metagenome TaxID=1076179 RepID=A0A644Y051_9ZZZZ|nr:ImmA/IrrE family metallo-endopeptidase [Macellibacteroides fermentans]